jgi:hypothetical protein
MSIEQLFSAANAFALLGWFALLLAPLRPETLITAARWVAAILVGGYTVLVLDALRRGGGAPLENSLFSAAGLAELFSRPGALLIGWVHYLAFDLWVGAWIAEDGARRRIPHWVLALVLVPTWLAGPIGLLIYLIIAAIRRAPARG